MPLMKRFMSLCMSKKVLALALVLFAGIAALSRGQGQSPGTAVSMSERRHPRIFLTPDNVAAYRAKLGGPLRADFQEFVSYLDSVYNTAQADSEYYFHVRNYAFLYALGPVPGISYGRPTEAYGA